MGDHECSLKLELSNHLELRHRQPGAVFYTGKKTTFAVSRRWFSVGNDNDCSISVTLEYVTNESCCVSLCFSIDVILLKVCGAQTTAAYSKIGLTRFL